MGKCQICEGNYKELTTCDVTDKKCCPDCIVKNWLDTANDVSKEAISNGKALAWLLYNERQQSEPDTTRQFIANACTDLCEEVLAIRCQKIDLYHDLLTLRQELETLKLKRGVA